MHPPTLLLTTALTLTVTAVSARLDKTPHPHQLLARGKGNSKHAEEQSGEQGAKEDWGWAGWGDGGSPGDGWGSGSPGGWGPGGGHGGGGGGGWGDGGGGGGWSPSGWGSHPSPPSSSSSTHTRSATSTSTSVRPSSTSSGTGIYSGLDVNPSFASLGQGESGAWSLEVRGNSGVSAQQLTVVDDDHAVIYDKVEANPLKWANYSAWGAVYEFSSNTVRPLDMHTNSFCAGGSWLGNGTLASVGGTPAQYNADYPDSSGLQSIRMFTPCGDDSCQVYDQPNTHFLLVARWYPTAIRFYDGTLMIIGGAHDNEYINFASVNEPTIEYWPRLREVVPGYSANERLPVPWLNDTLNANLFPISLALPSGDVFMCAKSSCILYHPLNNTYDPMPAIPNGIKISYPMSGSAVLLPLTPANDYTPEVMICGGSNVSDVTDPEQSGISSQDPASNQCVRMNITSEGAAAGWQVEYMDQARHMHSMVALPDGRVLIVNGAQTGVSSYGCVVDTIGNSNADHPAFTALLYNPYAAEGQRFTHSGIPASKIARMYHSSATLVPSGELMIAGSAPNDLATTGPNVTYPTEWTVEFLSPPFINSSSRPAIDSVPSSIPYATSFNITLSAPVSSSATSLTVSLVDTGYSTHGQQMNSRVVQLAVVGLSTDGKTVTVSGPPSNFVYPPGYGWLFVLVDGIWSAGRRVMVGPGTVGTLPFDPSQVPSSNASASTGTTGTTGKAGWPAPWGVVGNATTGLSGLPTQCHELDSWSEIASCIAAIVHGAH